LVHFRGDGQDYFYFAISADLFFICDLTEFDDRAVIDELPIFLDIDRPIVCKRDIRSLPGLTVFAMMIKLKSLY